MLWKVYCYFHFWQVGCVRSWRNANGSFTYVSYFEEVIRVHKIYSTSDNMFDNDQIPILLIIHSNILNSGDILYCLYHVSTGIRRRYVWVPMILTTWYQVLHSRDMISGSTFEAPSSLENGILSFIASTWRKNIPRCKWYINF